jgi:hypothetical protein
MSISPYGVSDRCIGIDAEQSKVNMLIENGDGCAVKQASNVKTT